jgi:hypothetical protein
MLLKFEASKCCMLSHTDLAILVNGELLTLDFCRVNTGLSRSNLLHSINIVRTLLYKAKPIYTYKASTEKKLSINLKMCYMVHTCKSDYIHAICKSVLGFA